MLSLPVVRTNLVGIDPGQRLKGRLLGRRYRKCAKAGAWGTGGVVGHRWGTQKVGCSSLGLQRPLAVMEGRERFGAWMGLPCRVSQRTCGPHEYRAKA